MVLEHDLIPFTDYLPAALAAFGLRALVLILAGILAGYLVMAVRYGPTAALQATLDTLLAAGRDGLNFSPRRLLALARLAFREAVRRKVLIVVVVFALGLLFGGWFLDPDNSRPAELYLNFVLTATKYLAMLLAIFLATISLPADFKNRTIFTIVTKPVTAAEIVLGRILGFVGVGTVLLAAMGLFSYVFVLRAYQHTHELPASAVKSTSSAKGLKAGVTEKSLNHVHDVTLDAEGNGWTAVEAGHRHQVTAEQDKHGEVRYIVGPAEELHLARSPIYGDLRFIDRHGEEKERGISVGKEWGYQSYIEGNAVPLAAAIWTFGDLPEADFADGLPVELEINVFRTHIGKIDRGLRAALFVKNPATGKMSQMQYFRVRHAVLDRQFLPRKMLDTEGRPCDLFADFVAPEVKHTEVLGRDKKWHRLPKGQTPDSSEQSREVVTRNVVEIWLQCLESQQYLGVAKADLYVRAPDASFELNFIKCYFGIWCSMVLITAFGVLFSTILSTPVALMTTIAMMLMGFYAEWVGNLATSVLDPDAVVRGEMKRDDFVYGGGPLESLVRSVMQFNQTQELPKNAVCEAAKFLDQPILYLLRAVAESIPNFSDFDNTQYLVKGFDIPTDVVLTQAARMLGYLLIVFVAGYFLLKTREVAR